MRGRRVVAFVVLGLASLCAAGVGAWAQEDRGSQPERPAVYRVTDWPANTASRPYRAHVERYLNEMAGEGWRLHSALTGQGARMMVFVRAEGD